MNHYASPIYFVTVIDQPASQAIIRELSNYLNKLKQDKHQCSTFNDSNRLLEAYNTTIDTNLTVAMFDVLSCVKTYKPLHCIQYDSQRPPWANSPQWAIKINTKHVGNKKVIRNCAQQIAAWFRRGIETAVPGQSYPWGPATTSERQEHILALFNQSPN